MVNVTPDRLLTASEVADYLTVSVPTIWRWLREGKLHGIKIGRSRRFRLSDVARFAASGALETREVAPAFGAGSADGLAETTSDVPPDVIGEGIVAELRSRIFGGGGTYPAAEALREIRHDRVHSLWGPDDSERSGGR